VSSFEVPLPLETIRVPQSCLVTAATVTRAAPPHEAQQQWEMLQYSRNTSASFNFLD